MKWIKKISYFNIIVPLVITCTLLMSCQRESLFSKKTDMGHEKEVVALVQSLDWQGHTPKEVLVDEKDLRILFEDAEEIPEDLFFQRGGTLLALIPDAEAVSFEEEDHLVSGISQEQMEVFLKAQGHGTLEEARRDEKSFEDYVAFLNTIDAKRDAATFILLEEGEAEALPQE